MARAATILGVGLLLVAAVLFVRPLLLEEAQSDPNEGLYLPPQPAIFRAPVDLERALLPKDEHDALAAVDLASRGALDLARERIMETIDKDGKNAARFAVLGLVEIADGKADAARAALEKALALSPREPLALFGRGRLRLVTRRYPGARTDFTRLTKRRPRHPEVWRLLALACLGAGDPDAAFTAAEKAVELAPAQRPVLITMASCLLRMGREREAELWLAAAGERLIDVR